MRCPECGSEDDKVLNTKDQETRIWRRRECQDCGARWTTHEKRVVREIREVEE